MWYVLAKNLKEYLLADPAFAGTSVTCGASPTLDSYPSIQVLRDADTNLEQQGNKQSGRTVLHVEGWVRNDDPDPEVAYQLIADMEGFIRKAVLTWGKVVSGATGMACKVRITTVVGDNDVFRPCVASRTLVEIEWQKIG